MTPPARAPQRQKPPTAAPPKARAATPPKARPAAPPKARTAASPPKARTAPRPTPRPSPRPQPNRAGSAGAATAVATARAPKRAPSAPAPQLEVVAPARRKLRLRLLGGTAVTLLFASLLGLAVFHSMLVQGQLGLDRTDDQIEQEQMRQRELREQVASLAAPDRIVAEATQRGMVQPQNRAYLPAVVPGTVVPPPAAGEAAGG